MILSSVNPNPPFPPTRCRCEVDVTLANGEVRRRWTNPERTARIELLCRIGMVSKSLAHHDIETLCPLPHDLRCALPHDLASELPDSRSISAAALSGASEPRSDLAAYSAWFSASDVPPASSQAEAFGVWGAPRRAALDALLAVSDNARKEARLRLALARGTPPAAPDLWAAGPDELRAEGAPSDALLSRLVLRWRPGVNNGDGDETTVRHRAFARPCRIRLVGSRRSWDRFRFSRLSSREHWVRALSARMRSPKSLAIHRPHVMTLFRFSMSYQASHRTRHMCFASAHSMALARVRTCGGDSRRHPRDQSHRSRSAWARERSCCGGLCLTWLRVVLSSSDDHLTKYPPVACMHRALNGSVLLLRTTHRSYHSCRA